MFIKALVQRIKLFLIEEKGASGIEYAVIAAMVALVLIGFMSGDGSIGDNLDKIFTKISSGLSSVASDGSGGGSSGTP